MNRRPEQLDAVRGQQRVLRSDERAKLRGNDFGEPQNTGRKPK
jgi:hypothetical protein